jgi:hypothetical protein
MVERKSTVAGRPPGFAGEAASFAGPRRRRSAAASRRSGETSRVFTNTVHSIVMIEQAAAPDARASRPVLRRSVRAATKLSPLLLSAGSTALAVLALVGAEMAARGCAPDYLVESRGLNVFSETLGWASRKGISAMIEGKQATFNARGYRGRELALPNAHQRTRVIVLGDSIAFGLGVSDGETFTHLLDLRENGIEAGNLAVQGYGPGQELLVLLGEGLRSDPDVVVLAFCLANDFADAVLPVALYDGRTAKPRFQLVGNRLVLDSSNLKHTGPERLLLWLSDNSHLFNRALSPPPEAVVGQHWRDRKREALRDEEYALRLNVAIVRRMDAVCRERGVAFILAAFPDWFSYRSKPWLATRFLESVRAEGISVVDMSARFMARGGTFGEISLDGVGHLSPRGHAISAEVLEKEIASHTHTPNATSQNRPLDGPP